MLYSRIISFFVASVLSLNGSSQNQTRGDSNSKITLSQKFNGAEIVLGNVEHKPAFPGGKTGWVDHLKKNINLSIPFRNKATSGTFNVSIRFIIGKDGVLRNFGAETNCGYGMEDEVTRCLKLSPKWTPAQTSNKDIVGFATRQLVIFKIKGNDISIHVP